MPQGHHRFVPLRRRRCTSVGGWNAWVNSNDHLNVHTLVQSHVYYTCKAVTAVVRHRPHHCHPKTAVTTCNCLLDQEVRRHHERPVRKDSSESESDPIDVICRTSTPSSMWAHSLRTWLYIMYSKPIGALQRLPATSMARKICTFSYTHGSSYCSRRTHTANR